MHPKILLGLLLTGCTFFHAAAQQYINVSVKKSPAEKIPGATLQLLREKDSAMIKTEITSAEGTAGFENVKEGYYLLSVSYTGYQQQWIPVHVQGAALTIEVLLQISAKNTLKEVTVVGKKPFIERQLDKIIVNVESSITAAGGTALEILERSPGVRVDQNDNIILKGKGGVIVMMDGKITPLSGADLANLLRSLPASAIEKIELITNPSARYDAAGNAGIINIRMKKDQRSGTNGSITAGGGFAKYLRHNQAVAFNHRNKKINIFGNYTFGDRKLFNELWINRRFYNPVNDTLTGGFDQFSVMNFHVNTHTGRIGMDYFPNKKTVLGFLFNGFANNMRRHIINEASAVNYKEKVDSFFTTLNQSSEQSRNHSLNLNFKHSFDSTGKELTIDADYAQYKNDMNPSLVTTYFDIAGNKKGFPYELDGLLDGRLFIYSFKADYVLPLKKIRLETGMKSSYVKADNNLVFYETLNGQTSFDHTKSNQFIYRENINAAYINFAGTFKKLSLQAGLRAEHAHVSGLQVASQQEFDSSYIPLFPSAAVNFTLKNKDVIGLSVSRRIGRPTYNQLNPFKYYIDPTSYREGDPSLIPEFTGSYELSLTHHQTILTLSYTRTRNSLLWVIMPVHEQGKTFSVETTKNLATQQNFGLNITSAIKFNKWWNSQNNLDVYYNRFSGNLGSTPLDKGSPSFSANSNHSFNVGKGWSAELNGVFQLKERYGYSLVKSVLRVAAGLQKTTNNKKGTLRVNMTDLFFTDYPRVRSIFSTYNQYFTARRNSRGIQATYMYRFGKNSVAGARKRTGGAEDEKTRAN